MHRGVFLAAFSAVLYGSLGYFGSGLMSQGMDISEMLFWRYALSSILILPFLFFISKKKPRFSPKPFVYLTVFGALLYGVGSAFYFESSKSLGTGLAMVIFFAYPAVVVGLSIFVHRIPLSRIMLASMILIAFGCVLVAHKDSANVDSRDVILALISGVAYALYVFYTKELIRRISPLWATFAVCLGSTLAFAAYAIFAQEAYLLPNNMRAWFFVASLSVIGTVLPVLLLLVAMKHISANKAAFISVVEPLTVLAVGKFLLGERVTLIQAIGAFIILCGAMVVQFDREEKRESLEDQD